MNYSNVLKETVRGLEKVPINDEFLKKGTIFLTEDISSESCNEIAKQLMYLASDDELDTIRLVISSPGGDVTAGLMIYDLLRLISDVKEIQTICMGLSASMGAILFMAGDSRLMLPKSKVMLHDPSFGRHDIGGKKPHEIEAELDDLKKCQKELVSIISERTGIALKEVYKITSKDSYYSADEALSKNIATKIITDIKEVL